MCESSSLSVQGVALDVSRWRDPTVEEVAAMLLEAAPHLVPSRADAIGGEASSRETSRGSSGPPTPPQSLAGSFASRACGSADASSRGARLKSRLDACVAADVTQPLDWSELTGVVRSEELAENDDGSGKRAVDVNSGGAVFFCVFARDARETRDDSRSRTRAEKTERRVAVVKFCADRLACVSEHFAAALAGALEVATPKCRLARREDAPRARRFPESAPRSSSPPPRNEWFAALDAAREVYARALQSETADATDAADAASRWSSTTHASESFAACLEKHECALVQRYVVGAPFSPASLSSRFRDATGAPPLARARRGDLAEALGRVFVLDCLLGNADRLPCAELGWRGNEANLLLASRDSETEKSEPMRVGGESRKKDGAETGPFLCAIDQSVPRRVPRRRALEDAAAVPKILELVRNRPSVAREVFFDLRGGPDGVPKNAEKTPSPPSTRRTRRASAKNGSPDPDEPGFDPDDDALWPEDVRLATRRFVRGTAAAVDACGALAGVLAATAEALRATLAALFDDLEKRRGTPEASPKRAAGNEAPPSARGVRKQCAFPAAFPGDASAISARATPGGDPAGDHARSSPSSKRTRSPPTAAAPPKDSRVSPSTLPIAERGTMRLRSVQRDARASSETDEWLRSWSTLARREKGKLRAMLADWSARRLRRRFRAPDEEPVDAGAYRPEKTSENDFECAFLDVTESSTASGRDVVDLYELWARVSRLSEKASSIFATARTRRPEEVAPGIFLGGALEANAKHTLLSLGVTHVLNCAKDEMDDEPHEGSFVYAEVRGIRDVSSRENADAFRAKFDAISAFVDSARAREDPGTKPRGGVLVHCFEGKSRSATAAAQHLIRVTPGVTAAQVMRSIAAKRVDARPNAWFARALEAFANERRRVGGATEREPELNTRTARVLNDVDSSRDATEEGLAFATRREKPHARRCPKCDAPCGVSALSVQAHLRREHKDMFA